MIKTIYALAVIFVMAGQLAVCRRTGKIAFGVGRLQSDQ